jgi:hypothetical protein
LTEHNARAAFLPLALLWLAVHAVLLAALLGAKFLFTKAALLAMLMIAAAAFLVLKLRAAPRKLFHSPVI